MQDKQQLQEVLEYGDSATSYVVFPGRHPKTSQFDPTQPHSATTTRLAVAITAVHAGAAGASTTSSRNLPMAPRSVVLWSSQENAPF